MKVSELKDKLSEFDQNLEIICYSEDSNLVGEDGDFIIFAIENVDIINAEKKRLEDGTPSLNIERGNKLVSLNITSDC